MEVAEIFNKMANEYDDIHDLWYAWLFSRLHFIIAREVICRYNPQTVLDVGCGTGFQSFLHSAVGARVVGVDIAEDLIEIAKKKSSSFNLNKEKVLFPVYFDFVDKYNRLIFSLLRERNVGEKYIPPSFQVADARSLPFPNESFDHVNCAGSTLSFIDDHHLALSEIERVLRPSGTFLLEVESRWNIDLLWTVIDAVLRNRLGYGTSLREAMSAIFMPPTEYISVDYPFGNPENPINMKIKLFTVKGLKREFSEFRLKVLKKWTIHSITNLIPSTYLDMTNPPTWLRNLFSFLAKIEERIPISLPGCSIVFLAQKKGE
ncbi:MAG: methyltransferase domain-containing protein [Thermoplasmatales archaeon]|nr:methyltransferase domain-containing protein [Thermoplasmatales archaeon]